jgi:hypothetical protein
MNKIYHHIRAYLYKNYLTADPNDYTVRVESERSLNTREICEAAVERGGADISVAAMQHAVELWLNEMAYQIFDGYAINTGWFTVAIHVKGSCHDPDEHFDPEKHTLVVEFHQGALIRKELPNIHVDFRGLAHPEGHISQVFDFKTGSVNDQLTPGGNLRITGEKIKIAGLNDLNGVYFLNPDTSMNEKVPASDIIVNTPSEIIIVIPPLGVGTWYLELNSQYTPSVLLNNPRPIQYDKPLSVKP